MGFLKKVEATLDVGDLKRDDAYRQFSKSAKALRDHLDEDQVKALDECLKKIRPGFVRLGG